VAAIVLDGKFSRIEIGDRPLPESDPFYIAAERAQIRARIVNIGFYHLDDEAVALLAGPLAEAKHLRISKAAAYDGGGRHDLQSVKRLLAEAGDEQGFAFFESCARTLVRCQWDSITALAERLLIERTMVFRDAVAVVKSARSMEWVGR
jgi:hypothetical protein